MRCGRVVDQKHPTALDATAAKEMAKVLINYTAYPQILPKWKRTCQQQLYGGESTSLCGDTGPPISLAHE